MGGGGSRTRERRVRAEAAGFAFALRQEMKEKLVSACNVLFNRMPITELEEIRVCRGVPISIRSGQQLVADAIGHDESAAGRVATRIILGLFKRISPSPS